MYSVQGVTVFYPISYDHTVNAQYYVISAVPHIAPLEEYCHNSKFGIFELLVRKETFADVLLTGIAS